MTDLITIIGNLSADPERKTIAPGLVVTNFRVGSTARRYDKNAGHWVDLYTNWYAVSAYRTLGEHAFASLHKGERVIVSGRQRLREWDNGTRKGVTAEIEALALGHDLLWGTSRFLRAGGAPEAESVPSVQPASGQARAGASTDANGWSMPPATHVDDEGEIVEAPF